MLEIQIHNYILNSIFKYKIIFKEEHYLNLKRHDMVYPLVKQLYEQAMSSSLEILSKL